MTTPEPAPGKRWIRRLVVLTLAHSGVSLLLIALAFLVGWGTLSRSLPDPQPWHTQAPASEFTADDEASTRSLDDYLARERRVFDELDASIRGPWQRARPGTWSRYNPDSLCNPDTILDRNWNRTLVLEHEQPVAGALLLHGLSDSPYSLRAVALALHERGCTVVALRLPGHGTCPGALARARSQDWAASVRVGARDLRGRLPDDAPMIVLGYSNGGALAIEYALHATTDASLPRPDAIVLFSPMIGINPLARFAGLYRFISWIPAFEKSRWQDISTEIDPFKYSSWPANAGVQAWGLTRRIESRFRAAISDGHVEELPPVLAFQSVVDATVSTRRLVTDLFDRLPAGASRLVLFDVNRLGIMDDLLTNTHRRELDDLLARTGMNYSVTLVTNRNPDTLDLVARTRTADTLDETPIGLRWPEAIFSLSHVAIPIPPDDPVLGTRDATDSATGLPLGTLQGRGERGVLTISESLVLRQRFNPFYDWMLAQTLDWLDLPESD